MVSDAFGHILEELGKQIGIQDLKQDINNACLIKFPNQVKIQIEIDRTGNFLILCAELGTLPPGKYRENLFREALRANALAPPRNGDFAFSTKNDTLVMTEYISLQNLKGEKVAYQLIPFLEKSKIWFDALSRGDIPQITAAPKASSGGGVFGLIK